MISLIFVNAIGLELPVLLGAGVLLLFGIIYGVRRISRR